MARGPCAHTAGPQAIARRYITGSMWRAYSRGERTFCGAVLPEGYCRAGGGWRRAQPPRRSLERDSKLERLLITPSTKGVLTGIPGVPEQDDTNVSRAQIDANLAAFGFEAAADVDRYEAMLTEVPLTPGCTRRRRSSHARGAGVCGHRCRAGAVRADLRGHQV